MAWLSRPDIFSRTLITTQVQPQIDRGELPYPRLVFLTGADMNCSDYFAWAYFRQRALTHRLRVFPTHMSERPARSIDRGQALISKETTEHHLPRSPLSSPLLRDVSSNG